MSSGDRQTQFAEDGSIKQGLELSLTAIYPDETLWTIFRNGKELVTVAAAGPLSALVRFGAIAAGRYGEPETRDYNADWTVERAN